MATDKIRIQTRIKASKDQVWNLYTSPEHITQWNFADPSWHCPSAENDMQVGGSYKARMEAKDGSFGFDFEAIYDTIVPKHSFTYTLSDGRQCSVKIKEDNGTTIVSIAFDPEQENSLEMQKAGWQSILNNFKTYVESPR